MDYSTFWKFVTRTLFFKAARTVETLIKSPAFTLLSNLVKETCLWSLTNKCSDKSDLWCFCDDFLPAQPVYPLKFLFTWFDYEQKDRLDEQIEQQISDQSKFSSHSVCLCSLWRGINLWQSASSVVWASLSDLPLCTGKVGSIDFIRLRSVGAFCLP